MGKRSTVIALPAKKLRPARTDVSRARIIEAAVSLLGEKGYAGFTIEAIVARSGVAKTTIYRHWPSRTHLAREVIGLLTAPPTASDTGTLRGDLLAYLEDRKPTNAWEGRMENLAGFIDAAKDEPGLSEIILKVTLVTLNGLRTILERGQARGELSDKRSLDTLASLLLGAMFIRHGHLGQFTTPDYVEELVDIVLTDSLK